MNEKQREEFEEVFARDYDRLRGLLLGAIESFNLGERHEAGIRSTLKQFTYDRQREQLERIREYLDS